MKRRYLIAFFALMLTASACKRETTSWNSDWSAPLAHGRLTVQDMLAVDLTTVNDDDYLSIIINRPILTFKLDTLLDLPDTIISQRLSTGLETATFDPGDFIVYEYDQQYTLGDIELKAVTFKQGFATIDVLSPWGGKLKVDFSLPNTTKNGEVLTRLYFLDAGTPEAEANGVDIIDMAGYTMEMTGMDNTQYNTFTGKMVIGSNEETASFTVTNLDSITFDFSFTELIPEYARGYFGQYSFDDTTGFGLGFMDRITDGMIDLDSIRLDLSIRNGFNLIAQSKITKFTGINTHTGGEVELNFPTKNTTININRADGGLYDYTPSVYPLPVNNANSNIIAFLENLSDSIVVGYELDVNPFGNTTGGDDEFFPDSQMELYLDGEFPLNFGANNLTIQDTLEIDFNNTNARVEPVDGTVYLDYENGFPVGAVAKFYLLDETGEIIDSLVSETPISAGNYNNATLVTTASAGSMVFSIPSARVANLDLANRMVLSVSFTTDGTEKIKITPDTYFDFKLRSDLQIKLKL